MSADLDVGQLQRCGAAPFAVFDLPPLLKHVRESRFNEISSNLNVPFSISQADTLLRFSIPASMNKWLSSEFVLHMKAKLLHADGTAVSIDEKAAVIANGLNGIWNKVIVSVNSHEIYTCSNYSHVSYLTSALMLPKEEHERLNMTECYYLDKNDATELIVNTGHSARMQTYKNETELMGVLRVPLFGTARCIPHGVRLDISLYSHAPAYFVHAETAANTYKLEVSYCHLHYQSMDMTDNFLREHQLLFDSGRRALLPFLDYKIFTMQIPTGVQKESSPQYSINGYPRRVYVGLTRAKWFQGSYDSTPYVFAPHNASLVKLKLGETELQMRLDQPKANYAEVYYHMFRALGWNGQDGACNVDSVNNTETFIYVFDCTPTMQASCLEFYAPAPKTAVFSLDVDFRAATGNELTAVIMVEVDQVLAVAPDKEPAIFAPPVQE